VIYSQLRGTGAIHVHPGGSVEFVSLLPHSAIPVTNSTLCFNRSIVAPTASNLGGVSLEEMQGVGRRLLQLTASDASMSTSDFATNAAPSISNSTTAATNSSSSSAAANSSSVIVPPSPSSMPAPVANLDFVPHPAAVLVNFGGSVLFSRGVFSFAAPFQSSRADQGAAAGTSVPDGTQNRIVITRAEVRFEQVLQEVATLGLNATSTGPIPGNLPVTASTLPPDHLLSATSIVNQGVIRATSNSSLNVSSVLVFRSTGLLAFEPGCNVMLELSDNDLGNLVDGIDGRRGNAPDEMERTRLQEALAFLLASSDAVPISANIPLIDASVNAADTNASPDALSTEATGVFPLTSSLSSLQTALSATSPSLVSRSSGGGVGLLLSGGSCLFRGGRLRFTGGIIAKGDSHLFLKKGARWIIEVEPTVSAAWGVPQSDATTAAMLGALMAAPSFATTSVSFLLIAGVEFLSDGVLVLQSGHLVIEAPLLQIEGHGQLVGHGRDVSMLLDNRRINRAIQTMQLGVGTSDSTTDFDSVLVENPDAASDPNAELYSFEPTNATDSTDTSTQAPSQPLRENLIAPCMTSLGCQSFQLMDGARMQVASLTFLHFLPRARAFVSSTVLEGGALVLDSGVTYAGRSLVANVSDASSFDSLSGGSGGPLSLPAVYIANNSRISMSDNVESVYMPSNQAWAPATSDAPQPVTQVFPSQCMMVLGNLTGNGAFECGAASEIGGPASGGTLALDTVLLYPAFYSPSPFSPIVLVPSSQPPVITPTSPLPPPAQNSSQLTQSAPTLSFSCNVALTSRSVTTLDIFR
jgi:hypothetical protein